MKYRVVIYLDRKVRYKIEVKNFLFWKEHKTYLSGMCGAISQSMSFKSISSALAYAEEQFGKQAVHIPTKIR